MHCLRRIAHIKRQNKKRTQKYCRFATYQVIEAFLMTAQLRWNTVRMEDSRLPKIIFHSELQDGARSHDGQRKRYKDVLKSKLRKQLEKM